MELETVHRVYYSNRQRIPLSEVAESLIALEGLIKQTPDILEILFPGTRINTVEVYLSELRSGSLYEDVLVKFIFGSQEKLDEFINNIRERLGFHYLKDNNQILSAILVVMALTGGAYYYGKSKTDEENQMKIENNNQVVINIGADLLKMKPEEFRGAIEKGIKDKDKLTKDAIKFVKPAKRDPDTKIEFDNNSSIQINSDAVKAMPKYITGKESDETIEDYDRVEVQIRAVDLDSYRRGWAGIVPEISDRRVKLQLDPHINGEMLMLHPDVLGNITVIYKYDEQGNRFPSLYFLREIHERVQK